MEDYSRVLTIQSHVVSGYVGNKSACFPLQVLGFEVDIINSVHFSNHTQYKYCKGQILNASDLCDVFNGLKLNDLHHYSHILTGYIGDASFASEVASIIKELKEVNPDVLYVCDPVMGDNGKMYVPESILPVYRDHLVQLADIITPNQYEAELLTGITIKCEADVIKSMQILHDKGVGTVIISSAKLQGSNDLTLFGSSLQDGKPSMIKLNFPELQSSFTGTGDLFSALLLAWMSKTKGDIKESCEKAVSTLHCVLQRTLNYAKAHADGGDALAPRILELKLIQSIEDILHPKVLFPATML